MNPDAKRHIRDRQERRESTANLLRDMREALRQVNREKEHTDRDGEQERRQSNSGTQRQAGFLHLGLAIMLALIPIISIQMSEWPDNEFIIARIAESSDAMKGLRSSFYEVPIDNFTFNRDLRTSLEIFDGLRSTQEKSWVPISVIMSGCEFGKKWVVNAVRIPEFNPNGFNEHWRLTGINHSERYVKNVVISLFDMLSIPALNVQPRTIQQYKTTLSDFSAFLRGVSRIPRSPVLLFHSTEGVNRGKNQRNGDDNTGQIQAARIPSPFGKQVIIRGLLGSSLLILGLWLSWLSGYSARFKRSGLVGSVVCCTAGLCLLVVPWP